MTLDPEEGGQDVDILGATAVPQKLTLLIAAPDTSRPS